MWLKKLLANELIEVRTDGRKKVLTFKYQAKELWEKSLHLLQSPVRKRYWIEAPTSLNDRELISHARFSGETVLSMLTMLANNNECAQLGMSASIWKANAQRFHVLDAGGETYRSPFAEETGMNEIEIWMYDSL